jgi:hypothetical protein
MDDEELDGLVDQSAIGEPPRWALEYLQSIYRDPAQPEGRRMRAAKDALPFESPKLSVIAAFKDDGTFAERLERAIQRSGISPKVIEHEPQAELRPMRRSKG